MDAPPQTTPKPGRKPRKRLSRRDIQGLKYFHALDKLLGALRRHKDCPNRLLHYDQLALPGMLHFFNPVISGLRSLQQASALGNVQEKLRVSRTSLGSLSEASRVFDPKLLAAVAAELAGRVAAADAPARPDDLPQGLDVLAVDGSLLQAVARRVWAVWLDPEHRAAKLPLEFNVLRATPGEARVTDGNAGEKKVLREILRPGALYLLDAGYGEYALLEEIRGRQSSFVARRHDHAVWDARAERPVTADDRAAGVEWDREVWLGSPRTRGDLAAPVRLVRVHLASPPHRGLGPKRARVSSKKTFRHVPEEYDLLLVTDRRDLSAAAIALLYRYRWTIDLFFRWFKCVLRFDPLLFESQRGVEILVCSALIASLLMTLWTGRKPAQRTLEMFALYFQGWATLNELEAHIGKLKTATP
jgi:hypothetical protein